MSDNDKAVTFTLPSGSVVTAPEHLARALGYRASGEAPESTTDEEVGGTESPAPNPEPKPAAKRVRAK